MKYSRRNAEARKGDILAAAVTLAEEHGYQNVTREQITQAVGVSSLSHHFGTMQQFRRELMRYAVKSEVLSIIAQGLVSNDPQAKKAPEDVRRRALASAL